MGGLGNGRRGGRSPPLMIGALIACIVVLGFNYWVSSSHNLELQTKLYELEGQVRRGVAERGVAEIKKNEFQEEIQRQKEQTTRIESLCKRQLEGAQNICSQEKGTLQQNVSSSTKTIQELKVHLNRLNDDLGKLQRELQSCQGNVNTLNNKLTYDMTHCHTQVLSQKELCDERVAAAKLEVQKKMEKLVPSSVQEPVKDGVPVATGPDSLKVPTVVSHTPSLSQPQGQEPELLTNEIVVGEDPGAPGDAPAVASTAAVRQELSQTLSEGNTPTKAVKQADKDVSENLTEMEVMDAHEEGTQTEADPGLEAVLNGQGNAEETPAGGDDLEKQQEAKQAENIDKNLEDELADYNGDDDNEGEFEADKQAELAQV